MCEYEDVDWFGSGYGLLESPRESGIAPPGCRWKESIRIFLNEICVNTRMWIDSVRDMDYWRVLVKAALNFRERNFWESLDVDGKSVLAYPLLKYVFVQGCGLIRFRIWMIGEPLWKRYWTSGPHKPWSSTWKICIIRSQEKNFNLIRDSNLGLQDF